MIKRQILTFLLRWLLSIFAMMICINVFAKFKIGFEWLKYSWWIYVLAGFIFAMVNSVVRPIATLLALPFLFLTLGFFTILINAAMVGITIWLTPYVTIDFWGALGACLAISAFNYLVNLILPDVK